MLRQGVVSLQRRDLLKKGQITRHSMFVTGRWVELARSNVFSKNSRGLRAGRYLSILGNRAFMLLILLFPIAAFSKIESIF